MSESTAISDPADDDDLPADPLPPRQRLFVESYLGAARFNATAAAKLAGYSEATAYSQGSRLLKNVEIAAAIKVRLDESAMTASEVLARLADMGRGTMEDFLRFPGVGARLDLDSAREAGKLHLVKRFTNSEFAGDSIELYDAQAALNTLGRHHGLFKDKLTVTTDGLDVLREFLSLEDTLMDETDGDETGT